MLDFTGIKLPFSANDLLDSGVGLLAVVGAFVLLALAFTVVPKLIEIIRDSMDQGHMEDGVKRDRHGNRMHYQSAEAKAYLKEHKKGMK